MIEIRTIFDILWKGFIIGVVVSAPLGPVGVLCIQRTLNKGRWYGFITGLGASLSDIAYALLTGYGMSFVFDYVNKNIFYLQLFGSIMLLAFGIIRFAVIPSSPSVPSQPTKALIFITSLPPLPSHYPIHLLYSSLSASLHALPSSVRGYWCLKRSPDTWLLRWGRWRGGLALLTL